MVPVPANLRRHFLSWDRPLLGQAVDYLAAGWTGGKPLDLSDQVVVVPTAQSGRRLREALADHAAGLGQAVFPPRLLTPDKLLEPEPAARAASRPPLLVAWIEALQAANLSDFREVFPTDPPSRGFTWALRLATRLASLQSELAEAGLRISGVPKKVGDFPEAERWRQLGELEARCDSALARMGFKPPQEAKIEAAGSPQPLLERRIVVIGVPDPISLALVPLAAHASRLPIEIVVFAPEAWKDAFDGWGRPVADAWARHPLELADFESRVRLCTDPQAAAERIARLARDYAAPAGRLGVGIADPEILPLLEAALARSGLPSFNPEGRARGGDRLSRLLESLAALAREPTFEAAAALARCPDFGNFLAEQLGPSFSIARWLEGLDELQASHLPASLAAAQERAPGLDGFAELAPGLEAMARLAGAFSGASFAEGASAVPGRIFGGRRWDLSRDSDSELQESALAWMDVVRDCAAAVGSLPPADAWELALSLFAETVRTEDKPAGALELQGWLELLYEDAPHLVVAGFNEGRVPDSIAGDPFLPEGLRGKLGLKTNAARLARDAYILSAVDGCRRGPGTLDLLVGKVSAAGDPLRPSRLLLKCSDAELPRRVEFLFRDIAAERASPAWRRAWRLGRPPPSRFERLPVTAFRDYLACPYRFFLKHALDLSEFDPQKAEMDALEFGTLCHGTLEALARDPALRDCADPRELRRFLQDAAERQLCAAYGRELSLPLLVQLESARQRLGQAAAVLAREREEGWVVEAVEKPFTLEIGGIQVRGKIDRIERNERTGGVRILDFKTTDEPETPIKAHTRGLRKIGESAPEFSRFSLGSKTMVWNDMQLPLYLLAVEPEYGVAVSAGYFCLPKAVGDTGLRIWDDYDSGLRAAALRCAEGVATAISAGVFWPPAEIPARKDRRFASWFHHGAMESVRETEAGA